MSVPGMAVPGLDGGPSATSGPYEYIGPWPLYYLDYVDVITRETLQVMPGGFYTMIPVNSRAGLTVPPPDHRWLPAAESFQLRFAVHYHVTMAAGRAHTAALHARFAARPGQRPTSGGALLSGIAAQAATATAPSEAAVVLAAGRAHNARRHALIARGEDPGGG
jgi:hypothetical protein